MTPLTYEIPEQQLERMATSEWFLERLLPAIEDGDAHEVLLLARAARARLADIGDRP